MIVERLLLIIAARLAEIQSLLVDVSGDLFAVDPRLAIIQETARMVVACRAVSLLIVVDLLLIDARLISIARELLSISDRLF